MPHYDKRDFPLSEIREHLEPGPIVLVSSALEGRQNIMVMGWHMMLGFVPARLACYIWSENHSFEMIRRSRECVINVPTVDLAEKVVAIGNSSGRHKDKFAEFGLTPEKAAKVSAPLIKECYASFECRLDDDHMVEDSNLFFWEVVKAHVDRSVQARTMHYRGQGTFMIAGEELDMRNRFKPEML
ncbi:flavin reductase [Agaricicola taiwanensis]|uniref:Flavin reductase n=1 Tax=Agaricicola taiwanensis TaxID=591372 RepID=A0A8J3DXC6_9RHOB|nr:flavin reductase family protein [Agaricicola taiwanensis]GGE51321.1 flavin reductase [Agaricicola taiwanensis]